MAESFRIALIDDDSDYAQVLRFRLKKVRAATIQHYESGERALAAFLDDGPPDLVFLDLVMPGLGGMETLRQLRDRYPSLDVVMVSAQSTIRIALDAIRLGARDYLTKGHDDLVKVVPVAESVLEQVALKKEVEGLRMQRGGDAVGKMIGESKALGQTIHLIQRALRGDLAVAVSGESGTGKELVAEAIHAGSARADGPFVIVNCAAIPSELMESEFFGHEKGAFTGATGQRKGVFEQANGGTLFLDEIGELEPSLQAKLLRTLQDGRLRRVGGSKVLDVDVRVISATNRDIQKMVKDGSFREDLYYRLFQFPIVLPPLRDRGNDVLLLAEHFLREFLLRHPELAPKKLSTEARRLLLEQHWPGNVRQLKTTVERAALLVDGERIEPGGLQHEGSSTQFQGRREGAHENETGVVSMEEAKARALEVAYRECAGNIERTAFVLGVTRSTVYRLLKKYGLEEIDQAV